MTKKKPKLTDGNLQKFFPLVIPDGFRIGQAIASFRMKMHLGDIFYLSDQDFVRLWNEWMKTL